MNSPLTNRYRRDKNYNATETIIFRCKKNFFVAFMRQIEFEKKE